MRDPAQNLRMRSDEIVDFCVQAVFFPAEEQQPSYTNRMQGLQVIIEDLLQGTYVFSALPQTAQAMFFPGEEREPRFIGATQSHGPILMHCGACEYTGWSAVR